MKKPKLGRPPMVNRPKPHTLYLDGVTWAWLQRQPRGASDAMRQLVLEKLAEEGR